MNLLFALLFGTGVAAFVYTKAGRRVGFTNQQSLWLIVGVVWVMSIIFFWTVLWSIGV